MRSLQSLIKFHDLLVSKTCETIRIVNQKHLNNLQASCYSRIRLKFRLVKYTGCPKNRNLFDRLEWAFPENIDTPPMDDAELGS